MHLGTSSFADFRGSPGSLTQISSQPTSTPLQLLALQGERLSVANRFSLSTSQLQPLDESGTQQEETLLELLKTTEKGRHRVEVAGEVEGSPGEVEVEAEAVANNE